MMQGLEVLILIVVEDGLVRTFEETNGEKDES